MLKQLLTAGVCLAAAGLAIADLGGSYTLPIEHEAIRYETAPLDDAITRLQRKLDSGQVKLRHNVDFGYLPAMLDALKVPVSSQVLVFSKTSFQAPLIAPRMPRAIYFNDTVSVGYVRGGEVVELAATDPREGVVFYTLDQDETSHPRIQRRGECLQCHHNGATLGVPGLVVRSVYPERSGMPVFHAGGYITDHRSPLKERWGGWYVSGTTGSQQHMGNAIADTDGQIDMSAGTNITDLKDKFNTFAYLSPHSDVVALMTLEHQSRMVNLITRVGWETRMALATQIEPGVIGDSTRRHVANLADELVRYMLFANEAQLTGEIKGTSGFASEFSKCGPKDRRGRSLRDFDLQRRMFRYPCSYLIYSPAFDALPPIVLESVYARLSEVLHGREAGGEYARLSKEDRTAILEILWDTKPEFAKADAAYSHPM